MEATWGGMARLAGYPASPGSPHDVGSLRRKLALRSTRIKDCFCSRKVCVGTQLGTALGLLLAQTSTKRRDF